MMEALDWNKIFSVAKETLIKPIPKGLGIKRTGGQARNGTKGPKGAKRALMVKKVEGGGGKYPCWFCRAMGFQGKTRGSSSLITHIKNHHGFTEKESQAIQNKWNKDEPLTKKNILEYEESDEKLPGLGKKIIPRKELEVEANSEDGTKVQKKVLLAIKVALGEEKPPEPEDVKTESKEEEEKTETEAERKVRKKEKKKEKKRKTKKLLEGVLEEFIDKKKKKTPKEKQDEAWEKLAKESAKPEPGIKDMMKLMKSQKGELAPEEKTELNELGKATVAKIKTRASRSKAVQADKTNISSKFTALEKSKLKRVPAKDMTVTSKVRGGKKPTLIISNA